MKLNLTCINRKSVVCCNIFKCTLNGVDEPVFGFLGFHLEVVTLLIWNLINSAVLQSALTLTRRLHPSRSSTIAVSSAAKSFSHETCRPAEAALVAGLVCASVRCSLAACVLVLGPAVHSLQPAIRWMFDISAAEKQNLRVQPD